MPEKVAVLIPCYNEEITVAKVVEDFKKSLPAADIYVYDNNSTDKTVTCALKAGAIVRHEYRQGKGCVMRSMFSDIDADIYVLVDGDDTYPAQEVHPLIEAVREGRADMAVGDRLSEGAYANENKRVGHNFGNTLVRILINRLFSAKIKDVMSGYRVMNRKFVKNYPVTAKGFEVETSMTIHALDKGFQILELPIQYRDRPQGSESKLNTVSDGFLVLKTIFEILKNYKPMLFFGMLGLLFLCAGLLSGIWPIIEFIETSFISHYPLALLATGFVVLAALSFVCAFILDSSAKHFREMYELQLIRFQQEPRSK